MDEQQAATKAIVETMLSQTGWTPTELARNAGMSASTLTRFLNKPVKHMLSARTLAKLSQVSGVAIDGNFSAISRTNTKTAPGSGGVNFPFNAKKEAENAVVLNLWGRLNEPQQRLIGAAMRVMILANEGQDTPHLATPTRERSRNITSKPKQSRVP